MISDFSDWDDPLPGELWWGALTRFLNRRPGSSLRKLLPQVLGTTRRIMWDFPQDLAAFTKRIPTRRTPEELLHRHTIFAFAAPFLSPSKRKHYESLALGLAPIDHARKLVRYVAGVDPSQRCRYCKVCRPRDRKEHGESYWHLRHQIRALTKCTECGGPLFETSHRFIDGFIALDLIDDGVQVAQPQTAGGKAIQDLLAAEIREIASGNIPHVGDTRTREVITGTLREHGLNRRRSLLNKACEVFGKREVAFLNQSVGRLGLFGFMARNREPNPCWSYGLSAALVGASLRKLLTASPPTAWPCMNPNSSCQGSLTIMSWTKKRTGFGRFECPQCGGIYERALPLITGPDGSFGFRLLRAGWRMASASYTVKRAWCRRRAALNKARQKEYLRLKPQVLLGARPARLPALRTYLIRNCSDWYRSNYCASPQRSRTSINWIDEDEHSFAIARSHLLQIRQLAFGRLPRLSFARIRRFMRPLIGATRAHNLRLHGKLPKTSDFLASFVETQAEAIWRRAQFSIKTFGPAPVTFTAFQKAAGLPVSKSTHIHIRAQVRRLYAIWLRSQKGSPNETPNEEVSVGGLSTLHP